MSQIDEKILELQAGYDKYISIDQRYRENTLSAHQGKKIKIYESDEIKQKKEKGIAHNMYKYAPQPVSSATNKALSLLSTQLYKTSINLLLLTLHVILSIVALLVVYVVMQVLVLPMIPEVYQTPSIIVAAIFTFVLIFKA